MNDPSYLAQFAQFFNTKVLKELAVTGSSSLISETLKYSGYMQIDSKLSFRELYNRVYDLLLDKYRCEYVYINSIANQIMLEKHGYPNSILQTQLNTQNRIVDAVIFNGTSTAYEIKSELDSLTRLKGQIEEYKRIFGHVYVVSYPQLISNISKAIPDGVGIIQLNKNNKLETVKESVSNVENVQPNAIFDLLRTAEYCSVIQAEFGYLPDVSNAFLYTECKKLFSQLPPSKAHQYMVNAYRERANDRLVEGLVEKLPFSLKAICFRNKLTRPQWRNLCSTLNTKCFS